MNIGILTSHNESPWRYYSTTAERVVRNALESKGHKTTLIDPEYMDLTLIHHLNVEIIFIARHDAMVTRGYIQAFLDIQHIPYTGSDITIATKTYRKSQMKSLWEQSNLPSLPWTTINRDLDLNTLYSKIDDLSFPALVRPDIQSLSLGVDIVYTPNDFFDAIQNSFNYDHSSIIETISLESCFFSCIIINNKALPIVEQEPSTSSLPFKSLTFIKPRKLTYIQEKHIQCIALKAYNELDCKGWGQVDVCLHNNDFWIVNFNISPAIYPKSAFCIAVELSDYSLDDTVETIAKYSDFNNI